MAVSGTVEVSVGSTWRRATTGVSLNQGDKIKLGERSYAAVVMDNRRTIELKSAGEYSLSALASQATGRPGSVTEKYVNYVLNRSTSSKLGNNMSSLGAVERSLTPTPLAPYPSKSSGEPAYLAQDEITFRWLAQKNTKSYLLRVSDDEGNVLLEQTVADTFYVAPAGQLSLQTERLYYWKVAPSTTPGLATEELAFTPLANTKKAEVAAAVQDIRQSLGDESAASYMVLASYYQDQLINDQALNYYQKALAAAPDVPEYRLMFAEFLQRLGLSSYALQIAQPAQQR